MTLDQFDTNTTRDIVQSAEAARSNAFDARNLLKQVNEQLLAEQAKESPALTLAHCDLQRATEAAEQAAEQSAKALAALHRNLMTVLGYQLAQERDRPVTIVNNFSYPSAADYPPVSNGYPPTCPNRHPHVDSRRLTHTQLAQQTDTYSFYACGSVHTETSNGRGGTGDWSLTDFCRNVPNPPEAAAA